ncbi:hypothetical protein [Dactylosporangium sp. NPDC049140]|uniref:hypothetical protein n=1 Tax=Dactylosporangium sp. NPDC049140 TaxID=3155647 RepID=UPI0033DF9373
MSLVLFDGVIPVAYHLFWIREEDELSTADGVGGQRNGLCGAAEPGMLVFLAGTHSGPVRLRVELLDGAPGPAGDEWTEVVEVSYRTPDEDVVLALWEGDAIELGLPGGEYRVRYSCRDFDREESERYLVQFWAAPAAGDAVLRQTSAAAGYWHGVARKRAAPPTAAERAERARDEEEQRRRRDAELRRKDQERYWGGAVPEDPRLLAIAPSVVGIARLDRALVDEIAEIAAAAADDADGGRLRAVAGWAARRACVLAGLDSQGWVAAALDALDTGSPPPASFADFDAAISRWLDVPRERITHHATVTFGPSPQPSRIEPAVSAISAVIAARDPDPLDAVFGALRGATEAGPDRIGETLEQFRTRLRETGEA